MGDTETTTDVRNRIENARRRLAAARLDPPERALRRRLPALAGVVPWRPLAGAIPTPLEAIEIGGTEFLVKREDLVDDLYAGNKIRKLEYLLAAAECRRRGVVAFGAAGSHHLLATVLFASAIDLPVAVAVVPQLEPNPAIAVNRRVLAELGVPVATAAGYAGMPAAVLRGAAALEAPTLVNLGPATPAGVIGWVDAACEIADQLAETGRQAPDVAYCPLGTGNTAIGLAIGFELCGLPTRVAAVQTVSWSANNALMRTPVIIGAARLLRCAGARVDVAAAAARIHVVDRYLGDGYGARTPAGMRAGRLAGDAGVAIEQTYSAKALAAAIDAGVAGDSVRPLFVATASGARAVV